jgi:hypothetical protein
MSWAKFWAILSQTHLATLLKRHPRTAKKGHCYWTTGLPDQTKNPNLGNFFRALGWKMLLHVMAISIILRTFGIFYDQLYSLCSFGAFFLVLESCTKKNLATLLD